MTINTVVTANKMAHTDKRMVGPSGSPFNILQLPPQRIVKKANKAASLRQVFIDMCIPSFYTSPNPDSINFTRV